MDRAATSLSLKRTVAIALAIGAAISGLAFLPLVGIRPDIAEVALSWRFLAKAAVVLMIAGGAIGLTLRLASPDGELGRLKWAPWLVLLILTLAVVTELIVVPTSQWGAQLFGLNWLFCLGLILLFSLPPLVGLLVALKRAAPRNGESCRSDRRNRSRRHWGYNLRGPLPRRQPIVRGRLVHTRDRFRRASCRSFRGAALAQVVETGLPQSVARTVQKPRAGLMRGTMWQPLPFRLYQGLLGALGTGADRGNPSSSMNEPNRVTAAIETAASTTMANKNLLGISHLIHATVCQQFLHSNQE